jgi:uncharacterized protein YjbI with pentapeptide repeats
LTEPVPPHAPDLPSELEAAEVPEGRLHDLRLEQVRLAADLSGRVASGLTLQDVVAEDGDWSNLRADQASFLRVEATGVRGTGVELGEATLRDVVFDGCRLDLSSFRHAKLERVVFRDCRLEEAELYGAELHSVRFERTNLAGASIEAASFADCELRACELAGLRGVERLRGVRMPWPDVVQIAGLLATAAGIEIVD